MLNESISANTIAVNRVIVVFFIVGFLLSQKIIRAPVARQLSAVIGLTPFIVCRSSGYFFSATSNTRALAAVSRWSLLRLCRLCRSHGFAVTPQER
jgi:hypothetical protein